MSAKKLDGIRDKIASLVDERDETESAAIPREEATAHFDRLIARVRDDWTNGSVPQGLADGSVIERTLAEWLGRPAAMCALFGDEIRDNLLKHYDEQVGDTPQGLPVAERRKRLTALHADIYTLEQEEERTIEAMEADGADIQRRVDADPRAALGIGASEAA